MSATTTTAAEQGATPPPELIDALRESVKQVLATMVDARCVDADGGQGADMSVHALVDFQGAHAGTLSVACSGDGAEGLARGLLMLAPEDPLARDEIEDAVKECANMVAGVLKTRAFGADGDARLSVPRIADAPLPQGTLWWRVQDGAVAVGLRRAS